MDREIRSAVPGEWAPGAELVSTAEALAALCWLLSQPGPVGRATGAVATVEGRVRPRPAGGRLATDPGA